MSHVKPSPMDPAEVIIHEVDKRAQDTGKTKGNHWLKEHDEKKDNENAKQKMYSNKIEIEKTMKRQKNRREGMLMILRATIIKPFELVSLQIRDEARQVFAGPRL